jgi:spore coat protein U-like protein
MILRTLITITLLFFFRINSSLAADCSIVDAKLNFGILNKNPNMETLGEITVTCSNMTGDVPYSVELENSKELTIDDGQGSKLNYILFTSANYSSMWSQKNPIKSTVKNIGGYGKSVIPFYGKIVNYNRLFKAGEYSNKGNLPIIKLIY